MNDVTTLARRRTTRVLVHGRAHAGLGAARGRRLDGGVRATASLGTIGGGQLEFQAIARGARAGSPGGAGGRACSAIRWAPAWASAAAAWCTCASSASAPPTSPALQTRLLAHLTPVALFGGGHVGAALVRLLAHAALRGHLDRQPRRDLSADALPAQVACEHSDPVQAAVADLAPGSRVLIMSFSHAEDLDIVAACLQRLRERDDLPYVGLIGSKTKWATFRHRLEERGFTPRSWRASPARSACRASAARSRR